MDPILRVEGLRKVFHSRRRVEVVAVDKLGFSVATGEVVGLLGPNGAGKTTTIKCLCTLIHPTEGRIEVDGIDAVARPRQAVAKMAAVLEGNRNIYWRLNPVENLEFYAGLYGISARSVRSEITELLEGFRLEDKASSESRTLSRGMQQKLAVACAFIRRTPILLLDEPTLGLDVETSHELRVSLREMARTHGKTILLSSHDMDVVQSICDRVIIINQGRVVTDDRIDNLLELFRVRAYRFTLAGLLDQQAEIELKVAFPHADVVRDTHHSMVDVELSDASQFYDLVEVLKTSRAVIDSIDRQDPNLEEIFLRIVKGDTVE